MKFISFIIPCYRSEKTLPSVIQEIEKKMWELLQAGKDYCYEIILINDCSPDETYRTIKKICETHSHVKGIDFSKNFGQHAALMAGLRMAKGDYIVCMDDDGQTPANEVDKLLDKLDMGYDAVYAQYENKQHSGFRNWGSRINENMLRIMLNKPKDLYVSSYFAVRRFVVEDMIRYQNAYPYVIGLVLRTTKKVTNVVVQHRIRSEGKSGYTLKKLLGLWFNGFTAFSVKPLRIATILGVVFAIMGFIYGIYTIIKKVFNPAVPVGFSSLMAVLVLFGGIIMIMLGMIGEYIGRIYISMNNSPQYVIREIIRINESKRENDFNNDK